MDKYFMLDARGTSLEGKYQILERTLDYPEGITCAVYNNKKDTLKKLKELNKE